MQIDRMFFSRFETIVRENTTIAASVEAGDWNRLIAYVNREVFDKPSEFYTLEKLRKAAAVDRRLTLREILEKVFGLIPSFKSREDLWKKNSQSFWRTANQRSPMPCQQLRIISKRMFLATRFGTSSKPRTLPASQPTPSCRPATSLRSGGVPDAHP